MLSALLMLATAGSPPGGWAQFQRSISLIGVSDSIEIGLDSPGAKTQAYRLQLTHRTPQVTRIAVTDSLSCPAVRQVVASMRDLEMPHPAPVIPGESIRIWVMDGTQYTLHAPSTYQNGAMTIDSNGGSPLARWVDGALKALEPCWSPAEPPR